VDPGRDECGTLALARDAAELDDLKAQAAAFPDTTLLARPADWLKLEPRLSASLAGALWLADDHHVDPRRLCEALLVSLERRRVEIVRGVTVTELLGAGGRIEGAATDAGPQLAGTTVVAAGAWAGGLAGAPEPCPVRPRKGQLLVLEMPDPPRRVLLAGGVYFVPRPLDRRLLLGATMEDVGFDTTPTAGAVASLLAGGAPVFPPLTGARFVEVRVGLRPGTPDELPAIGRSRRQGLVWTAGHFRKGILLAPGSARVVGELVAGEPPSHPLDAFRPDRFA
jgi:glycine oxidase